METTASEIVNYKGNAESAVGSSAGGQSGLTAAEGVYDLTKVDNAADLVYLHNFQKNKDLYDQKIKDRDKLHDLMMKEAVNPGVLLDKDRQYIEKNYRDKIENLLIQNPDISNDNTKYQELQKLLDRFREAKAYGGVRLAAIKDLDADISKELDPQKRALMEKHRQEMYDQDIYKEVKPYQQTLDFDPNQIFTKGNPVTSKNQRIGQDGNTLVDVTKTLTPLKDFTTDTWSSYINNPNKTVPDQMDLFAKNFQDMPDAYKAQQVGMWNSKIDQANKDAGYKPGDQYYVPPINGQYANGRFVVSATTPEIVRAHAILKNYQNAEAESAVVSDLPSKILQEKANALKATKEANLLIPSQAEENYAKARAANATASKTRQEAKDLRDKAAEKEEQGNFYINDAVQTFDPRNYRGLPRLDGTGQMDFVNNVTGQASKVAVPGTKGIVGTVVAYNDGAKTVTSLSNFQLQAMGMRVKNAKGVGIIAPTQVIYVDGGNLPNGKVVKEPYFLTKYEYEQGGYTDKDGRHPGTKVVKTMAIKATDYLKGAIKGAVGEDAAGKENEDYAKTQAAWRKRTGTDNINGSIIAESEKSRNAAVQSALEKSRKFFPKQ